VWKSRDVLSIGCRWKIDDGSKIKVMIEPWIRGNDLLWVQSPQNQSAFNFFFNDLLVQGMKIWDSHKIHSLFLEPVAGHILNTLLFEEVTDDRVVWNFENHCTYTVKSGYKNSIKRNAVGLTQRILRPKAKI
jgi:hypothetical protein